MNSPITRSCISSDLAPLQKHGREADVIAAVVRVLLEHLEQDYTAFTPITMELSEVNGIEPDYCFYIDHWAAVVGKDRINWGIEPAPDLVIEVDVTSYTDVNDYLPYRVPEVWLFKKNQLTIYRLQDESYIAQPSSRYFPNLEVSEHRIQWALSPRFRDRALSSRVSR